MGSYTMAARLSLVLLLVISLSWSMGDRRVRYRTEEDRRETRKKLALQRDPRRSWVGTGGPETRRSGPGSVGQESRRSSIKISRKLFEENLSNRNNRIFKELIQKKKNDDKVDTFVEKSNINEEAFSSGVITADTETSDLDDKSQKEGNEI